MREPAAGSLTLKQRVGRWLFPRRGVCRLEAERRFSTQAVAGEYEALEKAMAA